MKAKIYQAAIKAASAELKKLSTPAYQKAA
jgi:hypothetical protein